MRGDDACMECHDQIFESFQSNVHGMKTISRSPAALHETATCESCHGPGALHAEEGDGSNIKALDRQSSLSAQERNDTCMQCHTNGETIMWENSSHEQRSVSCADCHSIHDSDAKMSTPNEQTQLCLSCHPRVKSEVVRMSHHPIREGKQTCIACHNPHGSIAEKLIDSPTVNQKCFECHADIRGPHLWQHEPVVEDCLVCHKPHGASQQSLLNAKTPYLCQRCHSNVDHSGALQARARGQSGQPAGRALSNIGFYRGCLNCHSSVHGSNHPSGKSLLR